MIGKLPVQSGFLASCAKAEGLGTAGHNGQTGVRGEESSLSLFHLTGLKLPGWIGASPRRGLARREAGVESCPMQ